MEAAPRKHNSSEDSGDKEKVFVAPIAANDNEEVPSAVSLQEAAANDNEAGGVVENTAEEISEIKEHLKSLDEKEQYSVEAAAASGEHTQDNSSAGFATVAAPPASSGGTHGTGGTGGGGWHMPHDSHGGGHGEREFKVPFWLKAFSFVIFTPIALSFAGMKKATEFIIKKAKLDSGGGGEKKAAKKDHGGGHGGHDAHH